MGLGHPSSGRADPDNVVELERGLGDDGVEDRGDDLANNRNVLGVS
jgi:hypothetical protein